MSGESYEGLLDAYSEAVDDYADLEARHAALEKRYDVLLSAYLRCFRTRLERDGIPYSAAAPELMKQRERWRR